MSSTRARFASPRLLPNLAVLLALAVAASRASAAAPPISDLKAGVVRDWLVIGPLPNPPIPEAQRAGEITRRGFDYDFLTNLGGEHAAIIDAGTRITLDADAPAASGEGREFTPRAVRSSASGLLDFAEAFGGSGIDNKVAYAYTEFDLPSSSIMFALFGSDDAARVWVNGDLVLDRWTPGRGLVVDEDQFECRMAGGRNRILIKVDNTVGAWQFALRILDSTAYAEKRAAAERLARQQAFQSARLRLSPAYAHVFPVGKLPTVVWDQPLLVKATVGETPLSARWFDRDLEEVTSADKPGLYLAYVEGRTPTGQVVRRGLTAFCSAREFSRFVSPQPAPLPHPPGVGIDPTVWEQQAGWIATAGGYAINDFYSRDSRGAALLGHLHGRTPQAGGNAGVENPRVWDHDAHLALKLRVLGLGGKHPPLTAPRTRQGGPAPVLREGGPHEAGAAPDLSEKIAAHCRKWADDTKSPFVLCIARHGVIVHHGAYGEDPVHGPAKLDTPMETASVAKAITGIMFAQFLDQGRVKLEDPVGSVLPDLPTTGPHAVTFRNCFTHTTGLEGHREWDGLDNPWLENVIASDLERLQAGRVFRYNGMGYDLAGKAMEVLSGKSICRLMHEQFFGPLGCGPVMVYDLATNMKITAIDLARIGQLVLNDGAYGELEFFSPATMRLLEPVRLGDIMPELENPDITWGVGLGYLEAPKVEVRAADGTTKAESILSPKTLGHGSAVSSIFRVDRENDLVIAMVRQATGPKYEENLVELLKLIRAGLREE